MSQDNSFEAKKKRREYRREIRRQAREDAQQIETNLKPKPSYVPWCLWLWCLSFFIKIKK